MASTDIPARDIIRDLDNGRIRVPAIRWSQGLLLLSVSMLALAPLVIPDTYSPIEHTISESGGQGVPGAWMARSGVVLAACAVMIMASQAGPIWSRTAKRWIWVYSVALVMLAVFPESPWHGGSHQATVATMHSVAGVVAAISFIMAVVAVSQSSRRRLPARIYDGLLVSAVILIPQLMLLWPVDGILQRGMVALGYGWLFLESNWIIASGRKPAFQDR